VILLGHAVEEVRANCQDDPERRRRVVGRALQAGDERRALGRVCTQRVELLEPVDEH